VDYAPYECYGVRGKTIVIIGYGTVGRETARLATALGMRVLAVKAHPETLVDASFREPDTGDPEGRLPERVTGLDQLGELARQADYVVMTLPLTPATDGLIDEHLLRQLPQHAWLVNVGRGRVIDEGALIDCLTHQRIAGAWLDVFATEPLPPESPLWTLPNVTITPHISGGNRDSFRVLTDLCCENLRRYLGGEPLLNMVRREFGY
jgi:phosphoglycerate dehydrogenase-like enzyme